MGTIEEFYASLKEAHEKKRANGEIKISAGMIVRNSDKWIAKTLESVKNKVDEIVVLVDTRSDDATRDICVAFGCYVIDYEWKSDNFSDARRASIDACAGDWVLIIDGDETIECADGVLRELVERYNEGMFERKCAFAFTLQDVACGSESQTNARFVRKEIVTFERAIHNQIAGHEMIVPVPQVTIHHYGYGRSADHWRMKQTIDILENELRGFTEKNEEYAYVAYNLAVIYGSTGQIPRGYKMAYEAVKYYQKMPIHMWFNPMLLMASMSFNLNKKNRCVAICDRIIKKDPRIFDAWFYKGIINYEAGKFAEAKECFYNYLRNVNYYRVGDETMQYTEKFKKFVMLRYAVCLETVGAESKDIVGEDGNGVLNFDDALNDIMLVMMFGKAAEQVSLNHALVWYASAINAYGMCIEYAIVSTDLLIRAGYYKECVAFSKNLPQEMQDYCHIHYNTSLAIRLLGDVEEAKTRYEYGLEHYPDSKEMYEKALAEVTLYLTTT